MAMKEVVVGMELMEAQGQRSSQIGENTEVEEEGLGMEAVAIMVVVKKRCRREATAAVV